MKHHTKGQFKVKRKVKNPENEIKKSRLEKWSQISSIILGIAGIIISITQIKMSIDQQEEEKRMDKTVRILENLDSLLSKQDTEIEKLSESISILREQLSTSKTYKDTYEEISKPKIIIQNQDLYKEGGTTYAYKSTLINTGQRTAFNVEVTTTILDVTNNYTTLISEKQLIKTPISYQKDQEIYQWIPGPIDENEYFPHWIVVIEISIQDKFTKLPIYQKHAFRHQQDKNMMPEFVDLTKEEIQKVNQELRRIGKKIQF